MAHDLTVYEGIDGDTAGKLKVYAQQINRHARDSMDAWLDAVVVIGQAHDLLAGEGRDGKFGPWIAEECRIARRSAYKMLAIRDLLNKCAAMHTYTRDDFLRINREAWHILAGLPEIPRYLESAIGKRLKDGDQINAEFVREQLEPPKPTGPVRGEIVEDEQPRSSKRSRQKKRSKGVASQSEDMPSVDRARLNAKSARSHLEHAIRAIGDANDLVPKPVKQKEAERHYVALIRILEECWNG